MSEDVENCPFCGKEPASGLTFIPAAKWGGAPGGRRNDGVRCENTDCILFNKIYLQLMWNRRKSPMGGAKIHMECKTTVQEYLGGLGETPAKLETLIMQLGESRDRMMEALHFVGKENEPLGKALLRLTNFMRDNSDDNYGWPDALEEQSRKIASALESAPGEICQNSRFEVLSSRLRASVERGRTKEIDLLLHGMHIKYGDVQLNPEDVTFVVNKQERRDSASVF